MKWLKKLLGLCDHKWTVVQAKELRIDGLHYRTQYLSQCQHCGKLKQDLFY